MKCFICFGPATCRVIVSKMTGPSTRYLCCDDCAPRYIPQGDVVSITVEPLPTTR